MVSEFLASFSRLHLLRHWPRQVRRNDMRESPTGTAVCSSILNGNETGILSALMGTDFNEINIPHQTTNLGGSAAAGLPVSPLPPGIERDHAPPIM